MKKIFRYPLCLMYLLLFAGLYPLSAQWNNDPLQNLAIADTSGEQVLPKIQPTSDGGCYISWFDSRSGNYDVYLQRLNSLGEIQWDPKGLLISNHPQQSWLVDYDLAVDPDDNALLVFADIRNGGSSDLDIFAYKIAPDGSFLWAGWDRPLRCQQQRFRGGTESNRYPRRVGGGCLAEIRRQ